MKQRPKSSQDSSQIWRNWRTEIYLVDDKDEIIKDGLSSFVDFVEYYLHPTFKNPKRGIIFKLVFSTRIYQFRKSHSKL